MFELVDLISGCTLIRKSGGGPHSQNANILKVNNLQVGPGEAQIRGDEERVHGMYNDM